jgi:hypothetical protein
MPKFGNQNRYVLISFSKFPVEISTLSALKMTLKDPEIFAEAFKI